MMVKTMLRVFVVGAVISSAAAFGSEEVVSDVPLKKVNTIDSSSLSNKSNFSILKKIPYGTCQLLAVVVEKQLPQDAHAFKAGIDTVAFAFDNVLTDEGSCRDIDLKFGGEVLTNGLLNYVVRERMDRFPSDMIDLSPYIGEYFNDQAKYYAKEALPKIVAGLVVMGGNMTIDFMKNGLSCSTADDKKS